MLTLIRYFWYTLLTILLTAFSQIGGILFLISLWIRKAIFRKKPSRRKRTLQLTIVFLLVYPIGSFLLLPPLASLTSDRVPLPVFSEELAPLNMFTAILNRHYVHPDMKVVMEKLGSDMREQFPGHQVLYLDAGFPLIDGFPLPPHLSHDDGTKVDIAFSYTDKRSGQFTASAPSWIGYGGCEIPRNGEWDQPAICEEAGHHQYSFLMNLPGSGNEDLTLDQQRTVYMIETLAAEQKIRKMFLEPHLKSRWGLGSSKIRYHGCQAVRHDDHLHIQF